MEYSGLIACVDDLYVVPTYRNKGLATAALSGVRAYCEEAGIRAITVEVGHGNGPAQNIFNHWKRAVNATAAIDYDCTDFLRCSILGNRS